MARGALAAGQGGPIYTLAVMPQPSPSTRLRRSVVILSIIALFLLPVAAQAALYAMSGGPRSWRDADWSSIGSLPPARAHPEARVLVLSGRTGGWKGVVAVHSWIVFKREGRARLDAATTWSAGAIRCA